MDTHIYSPLELREVFHLEFLRWLGRRLKAASYALKGGVNLRFFFRSLRYSEDMDLDAHGIGVNALKDAVMEILSSRLFSRNLNPFGIEKITPPDIGRAKQTQTTQRFKVHLITSAGEDLFTKVEFSRRGLKAGVAVESVPDSILRAYKLAPIMVPHYKTAAAIGQKIAALAGRSVIQARDVFDLYMLTSQHEPFKQGEISIDKVVLKKAYGNIFEIGFAQFRDTVGAYLSRDDQFTYVSAEAWDEIKLKAAHFLEELRDKDA